MRRALTNTWLLVVFSALATFSVPAKGALLSDLITLGSSIQVGDKLFDHFSYLRTGDMPGSDGINVVAFTALNGDNGLTFQGAFLDLLGGAGSDGLIGYRVTDLAPNSGITGSTLSGNPTVLGGAGIMSVTQTFLPTDPASQMSIFSISPGSTVPTANIQLSTAFPSLEVQNSVLAFAIAGVPTLGFFNVTFSSTTIPIPEPASATLLGLGMVAIGWRRLRRK